MDTDIDIDSSKCIRCYECVNICTEAHKKNGWLGILTIDEYNGTPECLLENPRCHHCEVEINGKKGFACNKICKQGAMKITRW